MKMPFDRRNTRLVETVKVRDSGGRSLEVTIPKSVVEAMGLKESDKLIVLEDKERHSFFIYIDPKKASINTENPEQGMGLFTQLGVEDIDEILAEMKKNKEK